jgi:2-keto-4-pentenoate hydratase
MSDPGHHPAWVIEAAQELRSAELSGLATVPLAKAHPGLTLEQAYRIQVVAIGRRLAGGARSLGHKIGLTSLAMQQQMGVNEPDSGILLEDMQITCDSDLRTSTLLAPRVEAEIGFRLGHGLDGPAVDSRTARAAVAEVFLALEIIDTRYGNWGITLEDSVADNASAARFVIGAAIPYDADMDLGAASVAVLVNDVLTAGGHGRDVLGDPMNALVWLARRLHGLGAHLCAGDIVLPGAVHASVPLRPGTAVEASSPGLPSVRFRAI